VGKLCGAKQGWTGSAVMQRASAFFVFGARPSSEGNKAPTAVDHARTITTLSMQTEHGGV